MNMQRYDLLAPNINPRYFAFYIIINLQARAVHRPQDPDTRPPAVRAPGQREDDAGPGRGIGVLLLLLQHLRLKPHQQVRRGGREAGAGPVRGGQAVSAQHHLHGRNRYDDEN